MTTSMALTWDRKVTAWGVWKVFCLAWLERISPLAFALVPPSQTGFVPGRLLLENVLCLLSLGGPGDDGEGGGEDDHSEG